MVMTVYGRYDIDRLYRNLAEPENLWITQPSYDTQPRERRPADQLPNSITNYLMLTEALQRLTYTQKIVFRAVVMGIVRTYDPRRGDYVDMRVQAMTHAQCARWMDLSEEAVYQALRRARDNLAKMLSDQEGEG